ncbi:MAG: tetratricopeptide repeat protein [Planctomycetota bacterium]|nr:tetratricopeptide repeat protein [Planctomycetota bacterium]
MDMRLILMVLTAALLSPWIQEEEADGQSEIRTGKQTCRPPCPFYQGDGQTDKPAEGIAADVAECVKMLTDKKYEVRDEGRECLKKLGKEAIVPLRELIEKEGDSLERKADVLEAVEELELDWAEAAFGKLYPEKGGIGTFDGQCKPVLEELGADAEHILIALVKSPIRDTKKREMAARALGELGSKSAIAGLKEVSDDEWESRSVRDTAAMGLHALGEPGPLRAVVREAKAAVEKDKRDIRAINRLASAYRYQKEYEKCVRLYQQAEKINPKDALLPYNLACTLAKMGKPEAALDALESSIEKGYSEYNWLIMDGDFETLREDERYKALLEKMRSPKTGTP